MPAREKKVERLVWMSAAGNRFAVHDGFGSAPRDPQGLARAAGAADGLLLVAPPSAGGHVRMVVWNRDGTRAEACGNGLRAVARLAVERGYAPDELVIETDVGPRRVIVARAGGEIVAARAEVGAPRVAAETVSVPLEGRRAPAHVVDVGNPHLVLFVTRLDDELVAAHGPRLERDERLPDRTNVEFVLPSGAELRVRVWERGVGETAACGTGAAAVAAVARKRGVPGDGVRVRMPGGLLEVTLDPDGTAWVAGDVRYEEPPVAWDAEKATRR